MNDFELGVGLMKRLKLTLKWAIKAWFPYDRPDRPDRPGRLKKCSSDRDDHMETLPGRSQTIANDPDDRTEAFKGHRSYVEIFLRSSSSSSSRVRVRVLEYEFEF